MGRETKDEITKAKELVSELESLVDAALLPPLMDRLQQLRVTAVLLKRTLLPPVLAGVWKRCPEAKAEIKALLEKWRAAYRRDLAKAKEKAASPVAAVLAARKTQAVRDSQEVAAPVDITVPLAVCKSETQPLPTLESATERSFKRSASVRSSSSSSSSSSSAYDPVAHVEVPVQREQKKKKLKQGKITSFFCT